MYFLCHKDSAEKEKEKPTAPETVKLPAPPPVKSSRKHKIDDRYAEEEEDLINQVRDTKETKKMGRKIIKTFQPTVIP